MIAWFMESYRDKSRDGLVGVAPLSGQRLGVQPGKAESPAIPLGKTRNELESKTPPKSSVAGAAIYAATHSWISDFRSLQRGSRSFFGFLLRRIAGRNLENHEIVGIREVPEVHPVDDMMTEAQIASRFVYCRSGQDKVRKVPKS
jgi:hypothetical protein